MYKTDSWTVAYLFRIHVPPHAQTRTNYHILCNFVARGYVSANIYVLFKFCSRMKQWTMSKVRRALYCVYSQKYLARVQVTVFKCFFFKGFLFPLFMEQSYYSNSCFKSVGFYAVIFNQSNDLPDVCLH